MGNVSELSVAMEFGDGEGKLSSSGLAGTGVELFEVLLHLMLL